ncbi:MAG: hypothetical protein FWE53_04295 [Firmicutes bacterium]|nr:hypothetical protein [Bacillota bacterium]
MELNKIFGLSAAITSVVLGAFVLFVLVGDVVTRPGGYALSDLLSFGAISAIVLSPALMICGLFYCFVKKKQSVAIVLLSAASLFVATQAIHMITQSVFGIQLAILPVCAVIIVLLGLSFGRFKTKEERARVRDARAKDKTAGVRFGNPVKNNVLLTGAILVMAFGGLVVLDVILSFIALGRVSDVFGAFGISLTFAYVLVSIMLALALVNALFGSLLCVRRTSKPFVITLICINGLLVVLEIFMLPSIWAVVGLIVAAAILALLIVGLCLSHETKVAVTVSADTKEKNLALLKQLKENGEITEQEYKVLVIKELEK